MAMSIARRRGLAMANQQAADLGHFRIDLANQLLPFLESVEGRGVELHDEFQLSRIGGLPTRLDTFGKVV
jgi:hypothetical protein